ncbi:MAG: tetratricopeptide repeat protein, partial [Polyangiales bacterium]
LMRSALERLDRLADEHGAVQDLEKGIELDPDHAETASMLTKLLVSRGDELRASEILSRAAGAATTPERRAALWLEVARIQSDALGSIPAGISALNRVLRSAPSHVEALRRLAELYVRDGQWMEAVNLLGRIVQLTEDPDILRTSHLELAKLWLERLGDSAEALRSVEHVLRTSPEHPGALACLADIHAADGNWDDAVRTADQLLAAAQGDTARSEALLRMARLEQRRGRHDRAQVLTLDSVALDGPGGEAALLLKSKLRTRDEWVAYATAMERHIEHCLTVGHSPIPSVLELSRVHHAQLGDPVNAAYVLERGISLSGGGTALRSELAQRLRDAGRLDDSARELHHLIAEDPTNVGAYRELAKIHAGRGQTREARIAAEPIAVLGQLGANETEWLASSAAAPLSLEDARLGAAAMRPHLPSEGAAPSVTELLATLAPFLHKVYPPDYDAFGLTSRDKEGTRQPSPLRVLANDVCRVAGVGNIDLYVHRVRSRGVAMELSDPPALFVPASIEDLSLPQQTFLLSKPVLAVAIGPAGGGEASRPGWFEVLVAASVRMVAPQYGDGLTSEEVLEDTKRRIQKAISRKAKKVIEERAGHIAALPPIDYAAWSAGVHQCLRQFASLAADDLVATVDITRRLEREHQGREGAELVRKSPVVQGMVRFWLSDTANSLRRADASLPTTPT